MTGRSFIDHETNAVGPKKNLPTAVPLSCMCKTIFVTRKSVARCDCMCFALFSELLPLRTIIYRYHGAVRSGQGRSKLEGTITLNTTTAVP